MCVKGFLVLVLVLGWTQCLPQGASALPAMLRGRMAGFPLKNGWPGLRGGGIDGCNLHRIVSFGANLNYYQLYHK